ncbi:MAG: peptidylprolyl isomerase [Candidatus Lindowbacteria bacterium RIFCSPLOWO2_12_FULL_62_27]|nr:MAG: peptidylprolyl isomerase [Candidatus Lindowbacteria bacterium RIFCSPLOWO2_12_FULL_62_27]OGH64000.1 MAG: peptidylprolyl isomerase [Candidatus Lindowbacteria bacterium RIFCSPLOWO2_02_FULL_62_12]
MKVTVGAWVPAALLAEVSAAAPSSDKPASASAPEGAGPGPRVRLSTSMGNILIELDPARAPKSAANFLSYVGKGHYDGTIFHRVIDNFMVQGGGYATDYSKKPTDAPVPIESSNGLKNARGTVAMARTNDPNSATSQFYINVVDNEFLNYVSDAEPGYTVFGRVIEGMDVVDQIRKVPTGPGPAELSSDVPKTMVVITKASKVD